MKNILICEGKNPNDERLLMEIQSEIYLEASIQNLPNLVRELNIDMGEEKLIDFITYLKNIDCKFIIELGELLNEEEKKIENLRTTASSSLISNNKSNDNINIINGNEAKSNDYNQKQIDKDFPMDNIHYIFTIFKNLVLIGDKELLELLIDDNLYLITFGALEYDFETMKSVPHRKYFKDIVKFKNPLNIDDQSILKKINQNLRLTYLRDTALSRLIDDNSVKTINLMIQLNNNDLIQFFLNDNKYFEILFKQMQNEDLNSKKESCLFLLELIECSKDVPQSRVTFNENLFDQGILSIISNLLDDNKKDDSNNKDIEDVKEFIKITSIEIFINILSIIPNTILEYLKKEDNHKLLKQLINIMIDSDNFGIKYEISQIYKTLIETEFKGQAMDRMELFSEPFQSLLKYLNKPIDLPISHEKKMVISLTKQIIIEILISWFTLMNFNKQYWLDENKLNEIIPNLLEENDKVINLYTIKLLKCIIDFTDPFICNRIITEKLCNNLSKLFIKNIKKNNIIISCMMEFFESLSKNKEMIFNNIMTYQSDFFYENEKYFKTILLRYEHKSTPKKELINYLKNDYKENESLLLNDFDYKDFGELYGDDDKIIDYLSKKRERDEYNDELFDDIYSFENKKYNNDYYNKLLYINKDINYNNNIK
jgi:protein phosphatase-4 regulatory subunit 3